jgi:hypothetical protein
MTRQDINNINNIEELKCNYRTDLKVLDWFNYFTDYIQETNNNLYNQACEYADIKENIINNPDDSIILNKLKQ